MKKTISILLVVLMAVSLLAGCGGSKGSETKYDTFSFEELTFKVPQNLKLKESSIDGYDFYLEGDDVIIIASGYLKSDIEDLGYSIEEVKEVAFEDLDEAPSKVGTTDTSSYHNSVEDQTFFYTYSFVEGKDKVYDVHMACPESEESKYKDVIYDIISKIEVAK